MDLLHYRTVTHHFFLFGFTAQACLLVFQQLRLQPEGLAAEWAGEPLGRRVDLTVVLHQMTVLGKRNFANHALVWPLTYEGQRESVNIYKASPIQFLVLQKRRLIFLISIKYIGDIYH